MRAALAEWARRAKREVLTVYYAARDPATPWWLRALAVVVAGYAVVVGDVGVEGLFCLFKGHSL